MNLYQILGYLKLTCFFQFITTKLGCIKNVEITDSCIARFRVYNGTAITPNVISEATEKRVEIIFPKDSTGKTLEDCSSRVSYQHLCQLLCFSAHSIQTLASSCLVELLSHETESNGKFQGNLAELSMSHLKSVTLILQGAALGNDGLLRKNACICMMRLLAMTFLDRQRMEAIARSPWYKTVAEELLLSVAHAQVKVMDKEESHYSASMLSVILCISPPYSWLPAVFNPQVLTAAVESLRETQHVSVGTVDFFLELLKRGFLNHGQVEILRDLYQARSSISHPSRFHRREISQLT